jgi:hypothetical protein
MPYLNYHYITHFFDVMLAICPLAVLVSSSCSTDETVVADSEAEVETPTSEHFTADISNEEAPKYVNKLEMSIDPHLRSENNHVVSSTYSIGNMTGKRETVDEAESGNSDIIYSQDLIIRDLNLPAQISSTPNNEVLNFKRFRKVLEFSPFLPVSCLGVQTQLVLAGVLENLCPVISLLHGCDGKICGADQINDFRLRNMLKKDAIELVT